MNELNGIIKTKGNIVGTVNTNVKTKAAVSVGGVLVGAALEKRGLPGTKGDKGDRGEKGDPFTYDDFTPEQLAALKGDKGDTGATGQDGHSPVVTASKVDDTTTVYVDGSAIATINDGIDGQDGTDGQDGHSPVVTTSKVGKVTTVSVDGFAIATINDGNDGQDGSDGQDGADGFSPSASVSKSGNKATITITDKDGTTTADVYDGSGGGASAFIAEYGVTSYADVKNAYDEDAIILCTVDDSGNTAICQLAYYDDANEIFFFAEPKSDGFYWASIASDDTWDDGYFQFASTDTATQLRDGLMTALDKQKLDGIAAGAEVNVNADWDALSGDAQILNKPTIPTDLSDLNNDMDVSDFPNDAGYLTTETDPTVPSWAKQASKPSYTAAEVGAVPTTRKVNGKALSADISLTATDVSALPASTSIPSKTSDLANDSGFISDTGIFLALVNTATYAEVSAAFAAGKIVFAYTSNSYGSYNFYEYAFAGQDVFYFCRMHGQANSPSYKVWALDDADTWTNSTSTPWHDGLCDLDTTASSGTTDGDLYAAIVALGWDSDVIE